MNSKQYLQRHTIILRIDSHFGKKSVITGPNINNIWEIIGQFRCHFRVKHTFLTPNVCVCLCVYVLKVLITLSAEIG